MNTLETKASIKVVGSNGQIVPENEAWLHEPKAIEDLQRALQWAQRNPPKESDPDAILRKLEHEGRSKQKPRPARPE